MTSMTIAWRPDDREPGEPCYVVDGDPVGSGRAGFDAVLGMIRARPDAAVTVELEGYSLGGLDIADATPFAARFDELVEALAGRPLNWQAVR